MTRYVKTTVTTDVNPEFTKVEAAIDDTLSRKGDTPNSMEADLDMNSNDVLNATRVFTNQLYLNGQLITDVATGSPVTGTPSVSAAYAWTGIHSFSQLPTVGGSDLVTSANIQNQVVPINVQTTTAYTAVLTDRGSLVTLNNASAITCTIPLNASVAYPTGTVLSFAQLGAGQVTFVGTVGVTLNNSTGLVSKTQYSMISFIKTGTDTWIASGSLGV